MREGEGGMEEERGREEGWENREGHTCNTQSHTHTHMHAPMAEAL